MRMGCLKNEGEFKMDLNNLDWDLISKLILGILAIIFGVNWTINRTKNSKNTSITINGNNNSINKSDRDINNVGK